MPGSRRAMMGLAVRPAVCERRGDGLAEDHTRANAGALWPFLSLFFSSLACGHAHLNSFFVVLSSRPAGAIRIAPDPPWFGNHQSNRRFVQANAVPAHAIPRRLPQLSEDVGGRRRFIPDWKTNSFGHSRPFAPQPVQVRATSPLANTRDTLGRRMTLAASKGCMDAALSKQGRSVCIHVSPS